MKQERKCQPDAEDVQEEPFGELSDLPPGRRLFGESSDVPPSFYHCAQCNEDILAQDVVWDHSDQPRCPTCQALLKRRSD